MPLVDLSGKRILVTGASSGIGRACADLFASLGATVVPVSRRDNGCDLSDIASIGPMMAKVLEAGKLDGLVHAAGVMPLMPVGFVDYAEAKRAFDINYFAFLELVKHCSKAKAHNPGFAAVALSSVSSEAGWPAGSVYCGTKGALVATVRSMALELAPKGIRVNAVAPSNIATPLHGETPESELAKNQPLGIGKPAQVAHAVAFLLSDAASFVTGVNLPVDGGYLAQ